MLISFSALAQQDPFTRKPLKFADSCFLPGVQLLDTRTSEEFYTGHLANALQADWNDNKEFERRVRYIDRNQPVYIYCLGGGRTAAAGKWMRENGFKKVIELEGGIKAWKFAGLPVVSQASVKQLSLNDYNSVINEHKVILVDFGASWCPPCIKMKPVLDSLQTQYGGELKIWEIDAGIHTDLMNTMNLEPIPVFIIYRQGKEIWRQAGLVTYNEFREALHK